MQLKRTNGYVKRRSWVPLPFRWDLTRRNQLGLTHFSLYVDDVAAAVQHVVACGGKLLPATHAENDAIELVFVEDPDGVRVELIRNKPAA